MNGEGLPRNYTLAKMAFERGAALGDMDCIFNLGMLYTGACLGSDFGVWGFRTED